MYAQSVGKQTIFEVLLFARHLFIHLVVRHDLLAKSTNSHQQAPRHRKAVVGRHSTWMWTRPLWNTICASPRRELLYPLS